MDIYIAENIGLGYVRSSIEDRILKSDHKITLTKESASYGIGFQDSDFGTIPPECQIILQEERYSFLYKADQKLLHPGTLEIKGTELGTWLKTAPDLLAGAL
jgi:hypothetical protein